MNDIDGEVDNEDDNTFHVLFSRQAEKPCIILSVYCVQPFFQFTQSSYSPL